jgi:hypothetical protein
VSGIESWQWAAMVLAVAAYISIRYHVKTWWEAITSDLPIEKILDAPEENEK